MTECSHVWMSHLNSKVYVCSKCGVHEPMGELPASDPLKQKPDRIAELEAENRRFREALTIIANVTCGRDLQTDADRANYYQRVARTALGQKLQEQE